MKRSLFASLFVRALIWRARRQLARFRYLAADARGVQTRLLTRILRDNRDTAFGRDHGFADLRTPGDFRHRLPIRRYEDLEPYLARVRAGELNALLADRRLHMFALTSGTTAARKLIPVTPSYLRAYRAGTSVWGVSLFDAHPAAVLKPILQLVSDWDETRTDRGVPCGSVSGLTASMQHPVVRRYYCLPACAGKIQDAAAKYYLALRLALPHRELGLLGSANPSTLLRLAQTLAQQTPRLLRDLHDGTLDADVLIPPEIRQQLAPLLRQRHPERVRELEQAARGGELLPRNAWRPIHVIGTWTGGSVGLYLRHCEHYYGTAPALRDLGLLASEGRFTIPVADGTASGVLDFASHFFEFIPEGEIDSPQPITLLAHELEEGGRYYLLPTTSYGLYRYHIHDVVRCTGFWQQAPLLEFLNKGSLFSNLTGEKLSEFQVTAAMHAATREAATAPQGFVLAPCWDDSAPYYGLFLEQSDQLAPPTAQALAAALDRHLQVANSEYAAKRVSQRLAPIRPLLLSPGTWARFDAERLARSGGSVEQYKRPCLIGDTALRSRLPVIAEL